MRSKIIILLGVIGFILSFILCMQGMCSTNNLPAAVGGTVGVNSNGQFSAPSGLIDSNGLARVNPSFIALDEPFTAWGTADGVTWTNAAGWTSTAAVTNGLCDLSTNSVLSPWIPLGGLLQVDITWSNLVNLTETVEWTTNDVDWIELSERSDMRLSMAGYRLRFSAPDNSPSGGDRIALLDHVRVSGHRFPERIGLTNDHAGIVIRVDNPSAGRDAVNLQTLETRLAAYVLGGQSAERWSQFQASNTVNLAGHELQLDTRYSLSVSGDTVILSMGGSSILDIVGANTCTPRIVSFRVSGTNLSANVVGITGWRPYPQWTTNLLAPNWTTLSTNDFSSTFPNVTNGTFTLSWHAGTNATEYWRILAEDETGGTNRVGLATFSVPVSVPMLYVGGREVSPYSPTWVSNADYSVSAGTAQVSVVSQWAASSRIAETAGVATVAGSATTAGSASTSLYSSDGAHAARSDFSTVANYATNSGNAATATYATTAGYTPSAGNATHGSIGGFSLSFGSAAAANTNDFTPREWIVSIVQVTNLIVAATNGVNYNGPPLGTLFSVQFNQAIDGWHAIVTNDGLVATRAQLFNNADSGYPNTYRLQEMWAWYALFTNNTRLGVYDGIYSPGSPGTGAVTIAETYFWRTNWVPYVSDGTGTFARLSGPVTNQFAAPLPPVRWSGSWTNILSGQTNVLLFGDGFATNMVPL